MITISKKLMAVMAIATLSLASLAACSSDGEGASSGSAATTQGEEVKEAKIDPSDYENLPAEIKANLNEAWSLYQEDADNRDIEISSYFTEAKDYHQIPYQYFSCTNYTLSYPNPPVKDDSGELFADEGVVCMNVYVTQPGDATVLDSAVYRTKPCEDQVCLASIAAQSYEKWLPSVDESFAYRYTEISIGGSEYWMGSSDETLIM